MEFNKSQQEAVNHKKGAMLVLAGPGSGKTAVITGRVRRLIEQDSVPPDKILVITFSRAAAVEMKNRFEAATNHNYTSANFGTFHAVFFKIIKYAYQYDNSSIITEEEKYRIIRDSARGLHIPTDNERELIEKLGAAISSVKSEGLLPENYHAQICKDEAFCAIYREYCDYLATEEKLDFDDMMLKCLELFKQCPKELERWQECYEYILVDEFQDINTLQYRLVKMLAAPDNNLFVVGDDDQSVYGFRGAHPGLMFEFEKDFRGCKRVTLDVNYRCRAEILERAVKLIRYNKERFDKKLVSNKGKGGKAECLRFETLEAENAFIAEYAKKRISEGKNPAQIAVLYRMNHEVRGLHRVLTLMDIPCKLREHIPCIFDHWITDDMVEYMRLASGEIDRGGLLRIINRPKRYVTRESVRMASEIRRAGETLLQALIRANLGKRYVAERLETLERQLAILRKLDPMASVKFIRMAVGYNDYLKEYAEERGIGCDELREVMAELEESARGAATLNEWETQMDEYRRKLKENEKKRFGGKNTAKATDAEEGMELMTFHTSKGLEFDTVFIIDALEGFTPQNRAQASAELEEERRAFYVAMTRAREELYICCSTERLGREISESRFIKEMGFETETE